MKKEVFEEVVSIATYSPGIALNYWFHAKVCIWCRSSHSYPKQEKTASMSKDVTDLTKLRISDLTADEEE